MEIKKKSGTLVFYSGIKKFVGVTRTGANKLHKFPMDFTPEQRNQCYKEYNIENVLVVGDIGGTKKQVRAVAQVTEIVENKDTGAKLYHLQFGVGDIWSGWVTATQLVDIMKVTPIAGYYFRNTENGLVLTGKQGYTVEDIPKKLVSMPKKQTGTKAELKAEPKIEPKAELKAEPKTEPKTGSKAEPKTGPRELYSMYRLLGLLAAADGYIIKLPTDGYNSLTGKTQVKGANFRDTHIEVASAKVKASESKLNLNLLFKQLGTVGVYFKSRNAVEDVPVYTYSTKTVFKDCKELNMPRLGIAISKELTGYFIKQLGAEYVNDISGSPLAKDISKWLDPGEEYAVLEIQTKGLQVYTKLEAEALKLRNDGIGGLLCSIAGAKAKAKLVKNAIKTAKATLVEYGLVDTPSELVTTISPALQKYITVKEDTDDLRNAGIDISTGLYRQTKQVDVPNTDTEEIDKDDTKDKTDDAIEVKYTYTGAKDFDLSDVQNAIDGAEFSREQLENDVSLMFTVIEKLEALQKDINFTLDYWKLQLWRNNTASYVSSGFTALDLKEANSLVVAPTRARNSVAYTAPQFKLTLRGLDIK